MGARDRSYLVRDGEIDVMRNVYGGVEVRLYRCDAYCMYWLRLLGLVLAHAAVIMGTRHSPACRLCLTAALCLS